MLRHKIQFLSYHLLLDHSNSLESINLITMGTVTTVLIKLEQFVQLAERSTRNLAVRLLLTSAVKQLH